MDAWRVTAGQVDQMHTYWQSAEGVQSVDLDGYTQGAISETISVTKGAVYTVQFSYAGNTDSGPSAKNLHVEVDGAKVGPTFSFDITGHSRASMGWTRGQVSFTAAASSVTLGFVSDTPGAYGPALDAVTVTGPSGPVLPLEHSGGYNPAELSECSPAEATPSTWRRGTSSTQ